MDTSPLADLTTYEFTAINLPRIDERGTTICGLPARFILVRYSDFKACGFRIHHPDDQFRFCSSTPPLYVTQEQVEYALRIRHFARIGHDTLLPIERKKRSRKRKS